MVDIADFLSSLVDKAVQGILRYKLIHALEVVQHWKRAEKYEISLQHKLKDNVAGILDKKPKQVE
jgi:hypothetical protein